MNRIAYAAAAVVLLGVGAAGAYKALRWRRDANTWHTRWLALHSNPAGRDQYREDNARIRSQPSVPHRVVFLGASITERIRFDQEFPEQPFVNRGASGQLVWQQLLRIEPDALDLRPESVVLKMCAINLLPDAPPFEETQYYFASMADRVRARGVKAILATTVPVTRRWDQDEAGGRATPLIRRFNDWVRDQARMHREVLLDYASVLQDEEGYLPNDLSDDGLHPNAAGQRRMIALIRSVIVEGRGLQIPDPPAPTGPQQTRVMPLTAPAATDAGAPPAAPERPAVPEEPK
ncbi:MAG: GDSL-type esterase/lipase family protein [Polyangiales bacterium]